jgi:hypothetical protein
LFIHLQAITSGKDPTPLIAESGLSYQALSALVISYMARSAIQQQHAPNLQAPK